MVLKYFLDILRRILSSAASICQDVIRSLGLLQRPPLALDSISPPSPQSASSAASFMLLITRSLNNNALLIHNIITDRKLDLLCLTKT